MHYLHTTIFTSDPEKSRDFYAHLGLAPVRSLDMPAASMSVDFMAAGRDEETARSTRFAPTIAVVHRTDGSASPGVSHVCFRVEDLYATCRRLMDKGLTLKMPPRDGFRAMVRAPEGAIIEFHQAGERQVPQEPWISMADGT
ncbi:VOC family protein [Neorhizobium petrolearium]|uniref:VOC family protein n=1 Tax=Neorhizobium petrolearium TaxID=515361 RepID=UPI003F18A787